MEYRHKASGQVISFQEMVGWNSFPSSRTLEPWGKMVYLGKVKGSTHKQLTGCGPIYL